MKDHDEIRRMLAALAGGDLSAADQTFVEQHLVNCPSCRAELDQLRQVVQVIRATPDEEPPPWLATRIMALVRENSVPQSGWLARLFLPLRSRLPLEAFALVMICVTAWYLMHEMERTQQVLSDAPNTAAPSRESVSGRGQQTVPQPSPEAPATPKARTLPSGQPGTPLVQESPAFAPPPHDASDRSGPTEQAKAASESTPAAPAAGREQVVTRAAPMAERKMTARQKLEGGDGRLEMTAPKLLRLRLVVDDEAIFSERLRSILQRSGGAVVHHQSGSTVVRIEKNHLPELVDQLAGIGRVTERPVADLAHDGWLELTIYWQVLKK